MLLYCLVREISGVSLSQGRECFCYRFFGDKTGSIPNKIEMNLYWNF